jgi:hypothetical protein
MNQELFHSWFTAHFLQYAPSKRPLLLLLDGHASHYCPKTIQIAAEKQVILFALPPNTTHLTQPLDRTCFSPLKTEWKQECHKFRTNNPGKVVNRLEFSSIFARAWFQAMKMENIIAGFRVSGIYPLNLDILKSLHIQQVEKPASPKLAYIPFPIPKRSILAAHVTHQQHKVHAVTENVPNSQVQFGTVQPLQFLPCPSPLLQERNYHLQGQF